MTEPAAARSRARCALPRSDEGLLSCSPKATHRSSTRLAPTSDKRGKKSTVLVDNINSTILVELCKNFLQVHPPWGQTSREKGRQLTPNKLGRRWIGGNSGYGSVGSLGAVRRL